MGAHACIRTCGFSRACLPSTCVAEQPLGGVRCNSQLTSSHICCVRSCVCDNVGVRVCVRVSIYICICMPHAYRKYASVCLCELLACLCVLIYILNPVPTHLSDIIIQCANILFIGFWSFQLGIRLGEFVPATPQKMDPLENGPRVHVPYRIWTRRVHIPVHNMDHRHSILTRRPESIWPWSRI